MWLSPIAADSAHTARQDSVSSTACLFSPLFFFPLLSPLLPPHRRQLVCSCRRWNSILRHLCSIGETQLVSQSGTTIRPIWAGASTLFWSLSSIRYSLRDTQHGGWCCQIIQFSVIYCHHSEMTSMPTLIDAIRHFNFYFFNGIAVFSSRTHWRTHILKQTHLSLL